MIKWWRDKPVTAASFLAWGDKIADQPADIHPYFDHRGHVVGYDHLNIPPVVGVPMADEKTFWNGQETPARKVVVTITDTGLKPTFWYAGIVGQKRKAVEVTYGDQKFFLDNEDGSGWAKVTEGQGSPHWGHRSLPSDCPVVG